MDITFKCSNCDQELMVDVIASGSEIECPSCAAVLTVPEANPHNIRTASPGSTAAREERSISVQPSNATNKILIHKPPPRLEATAKGVDKRVAVRTFRHSDLTASGKVSFDDTVARFIESVGETNIIKMFPIQYSYESNGKVLDDFGLVLIYRA
ncbi:MAG: hypothetical protein JWM04_2763 [Verrucomicrobiales bacterium]|nr:hypothetical protein [Verrucomicrobiales bacterium]